MTTVHACRAPVRGVLVRHSAQVALEFGASVARSSSDAEVVVRMDELPIYAAVAAAYPGVVTGTDPTA
ncbi:MAG TPA: hypothetical protein VGR21_08655 [Cryptosporangiaceae bacterium]|nr:hypothetical protein [Cryptosporangiaceae bacterium]